MRHLLSSFAACLAVGPLCAQTTGVPGINDLTVNALGSGATSCVPLCFPNGGVTLTLSITAPLGAIGLLLFNFCPCQTCALMGPTNACLPPIPLTACGPSNQSLDLDMSPPCGIPIIMTVVPSTAGTYTLSMPIPPLLGPPCAVATLSVQAVMFNGCGLGLFAVPGPLVFTQSFTLNF
ncbi:MAG TPA: hypothetical protein VF384_01375 [Planctomycetota bacterium]